MDSSVMFLKAFDLQPFGGSEIHLQDQALDRPDLHFTCHIASNISAAVLRASVFGLALGLHSRSRHIETQGARVCENRKVGRGIVACAPWIIVPVEQWKGLVGAVLYFTDYVEA